jgi:hypothetical protein
MRKTLAILVASVLLSLSFMLSSCKWCSKKENEPAGIGGSSSNGGSSSATDSGSGSSSDGGGLQPLTPAQLTKVTGAYIDEVLVGYKRGSEHITGKDIKCIMDDIEPDTYNAFARACLESYNAWKMADEGTYLNEYFNKISDVYYFRLRWAIALRKEYNKCAARDDSAKAKSVAEKVQRKLAKDKSDDDNKDKNVSLKDTALGNMAKIRKDRPIVKAWNAFEAVRAQADRQWEKLCGLVDADRKSKSK